MTIAMPNPREPFVDPETGQVSRFWYRFLSDIRGSGGAGIQGLTALTALLSDLTAAVNLAPSAVDLSPLVQALQEFSQQPLSVQIPHQEYIDTQLRAMAEQITELRNEIDGLKQGQMI